VAEAAEDHRPRGCREAADIETETGAGGAQQRREKRGQVHGEQPEDTGEETDPRRPEQQRDVIARNDVRPGHGDEESEEHRGHCPAIAKQLGEPAAEKIAADGNADDEKDIGADQPLALLLGPLRHIRQMSDVLRTPE
jgi:hypothetical protein